MTRKQIAITSIIVALIVAIVGIALFFIRFGESMTFAVTNRAQVLQEKAQWSEYVQNYGKEAPKAN